MTTQIKTLAELLIPEEKAPAPEWQVRVIQSDQCLSYIAWNTRTKEAILVDPKEEDLNAYETLHTELRGYQWIAVIDTHTHADHVSIASQLAHLFHAPHFMGQVAPSAKVQVRIAKNSSIPFQAAPLQLLMTPGHTPDSITPIWGPFVFGGDTVLFGDVGRDDLPGGNPESHYESIQLLRQVIPTESILLPGHDHKGGRASSWGTQLKINASLTQDREDFIREAAAYDAPAPELLKKSLRENFK